MSTIYCGGITKHDRGEYDLIEADLQCASCGHAWHAYPPDVDAMYAAAGIRITCPGCGQDYPLELPD